jgi:hypothetical protein
VGLVGQMHKVIDYKKVDMSEDEFNYYKHLVKIFTDKEKNISGKVYFKDLFDVDDSGFITLIKTEKSVPWAVLFFIQQVMVSQRLRFTDDINKAFRKIDERLKKLESGSKNDK